MEGEPFGGPSVKRLDIQSFGKGGRSLGVFNRNFRLRKSPAARNAVGFDRQRDCSRELTFLELKKLGKLGWVHNMTVICLSSEIDASTCLTVG